MSFVVTVCGSAASDPAGDGGPGASHGVAPDRRCHRTGPCRSASDCVLGLAPQGLGSSLGAAVALPAGGSVPSGPGAGVAFPARGLAETATTSTGSRRLGAHPLQPVIGVIGLRSAGKDGTRRQSPDKEKPGRSRVSPNHPAISVPGGARIHDYGRCSCGGHALVPLQVRPGLVQAGGVREG